MEGSQNRVEYSQNRFAQRDRNRPNVHPRIAFTCYWVGPTCSFPTYFGKVLKPFLDWFSFFCVFSFTGFIGFLSLFLQNFLFPNINLWPFFFEIWEHFVKLSNISWNSRIIFWNSGIFFKNPGRFFNSHLFFKFTYIFKFMNICKTRTIFWSSWTFSKFVKIS